MNQTESMILLALKNIQENQVELARAIYNKGLVNLNLNSNSDEINKALNPTKQEKDYEKSI